MKNKYQLSQAETLTDNESSMDNINVIKSEKEKS